MNESKRQLYIFGYGLSLLIPFFIFWHNLHLNFHFGTFVLLVLAFSCVLFLSVKSANLPAFSNLWILGVQGFVIFKSLSEGFHLGHCILLVLSAIILCTTIFKIELLQPIYKVWMKGAHLIGTVITGALLVVLFYGVFGIAGIVLRLMRKDLLAQKLDKTAQSYWIEKEQKVFKKESYTKQY